MLGQPARQWVTVYKSAMMKGSCSILVAMAGCQPWQVLACVGRLV